MTPRPLHVTALAQTHNELLQRLLLVALIAWRWRNHVVHGSMDGIFPVTHYVGSCLTPEWVATMEAKLQVDAQQRDGSGRRKYPFLQQAVPKSHPRYRLLDPRTASPAAYDPNSIDPKDFFYGANAQVAPNGTILDRGVVDGSLIIQFAGWTSHSSVSAVLAILAGEVLGYQLAEFWPFTYSTLTQRMSSVGEGTYYPIHVDMEVWRAGIEPYLDAFMNESYVVGSVGYTGRSGLYTITDFVHDGLNASKYDPPFSAEFWKDYRYNEHLIHALKVSDLWQNAEFFPPKKANVCPDGTLGCQNFCSKSYACTLREAHGKECLVAVLGYFGADIGYIQAVLSNNQVPAYFCFVGVGRYAEYALSMQSKGKGALFYHYDPDDFHYQYLGQFQRVSLPNPSDERAALATGSFGEQGYGQPTTNPADVDFPLLNLLKYAANVLLDHPPIASLVSRFDFPRNELDKLMVHYVRIVDDQQDLNKAYFDVACHWIQENPLIWSKWIDPLPLCTLETDVQSSCRNGTSSQSGFPTSVVSFQWKQSHPDDASKPFACDGGLTQLPEPLVSHLPCSELASKAASELTVYPRCDESFYSWTISECDAKAQRTIQYLWVVPQPTNVLLSLECHGGIALPPDDSIACEYFPTNSGGFIALAVASCLFALVFLLLMALVFRFRKAPVLAYGESENLQVMLVGGLLLCALVFVRGGKPSRASCALRVALLVVALQCLVGSLVAKSFATYRLSQYKANKRRERLPAVRKSTLQLVGGLFAVDCTLLLAWFVVLQHPKPTIRAVHPVGVAFTKAIPQQSCDPGNQSAMFVVGLWKFLQMVASTALSLQNRRVPFDFGEWFWLAGCNFVVVAIAILVLSVHAGLELTPTVGSTLELSLLLTGAVTINGLMVIPKFLHLSQQVNSEIDKISKLSLTLSFHRGAKDNNLQRIKVSQRVLRVVPTAQEVDHQQSVHEKRPPEPINAGE